MSKTTKIVLISLGAFVFIVILAFWALISSYNSIRGMDEAVKKEWAEVENVYQRRADLIPNLVNTVKGYANFEQETLTGVIEARSKATSINVDANNLTPTAIANFQKAQEGLSGALSRLMVTVERYPELKANQNFLELQSQLEGTENRISIARRRFNESVNILNTTIRTIPGVFIAPMAGVVQRGYFEADAGADKVPEVKF